ncbi:hypothetical protein ANCCAN_01135 [Ancylostoma caninum]|uniref:Uncharacterized protein n=1 Tax=Ancylostoma caninum TaxID=29170 RepID=A0A368HAM3_ANCCA|nr:hypothetical protein ANCCAN_01135 [Ancylostoma caninum]
MQYMRNTWLPPNDTFHGLWNHSNNEGTGKIIFAETSYTRIRHTFGARTPNLREMVKYCREELTMAKATEEHENKITFV